MTTQQTPRSLDDIDPSMVAGRDGVEPEDVGPIEETIELQVTIALDARIGRDAPCVVGDVRIDHRALKVVGEVEDEMIDPELLRHATCIVDVADTATARIAFPAPQTQCHTDDVMSGFFQESSGDRRIDATRHGDENFHDTTPDDLAPDDLAVDDFAAVLSRR